MDMIHTVITSVAGVGDSWSDDDDEAESAMRGCPQVFVGSCDRLLLTIDFGLGESVGRDARRFTRL